MGGVTRRSSAAWRAPPASPPWPLTTTWPPPSCGTRCTSSSRPCPSTPSTPPSWRPSTTPPSTPRREASAPSTAGKQHHPRPPLEDPGHPHRTPPSTMLLYPVYHNATILCTSCTIAPPYYVPCTTARSFTPPHVLAMLPVARQGQRQCR